MTFETDEAHLRPGQQSWIRRAVWFMAARATFEAHRSMLEGEGAALVAVAFQAPGLVGGEQLRHGWADGSVRIVAIDTGHCALGQFVMSRPLELRPYADMAALALLVDRHGRARDHSGRTVGVDLVASRAGDQVLEVAAQEPAGVSRLVEMAGEAEAVGFGCSEPGGIADVGGRGGFGMFLRGPMAGFAGPALPAAFRVGIHRMMRAFAECVRDILVAGLTGLRPGVRGGRALGGAIERSATEDHPRGEEASSHSWAHRIPLLRMNLAYGEGRSRAMAGLAAFAERGRVRQRVRGGGELDVASRAGGSDRLYRIDGTLRIGYRIESCRQILFAAIDMA